MQFGLQAGEVSNAGRGALGIGTRECGEKQAEQKQWQTEDVQRLEMMALLSSVDESFWLSAAAVFEERNYSSHFSGMPAPLMPP